MVLQMSEMDKKISDATPEHVEGDVLSVGEMDDEWLPIDTGPTDGTPVWAISMDAQSPAPRVSWFEPDGRWVLVHTAEKFVASGPCRWWPTHWKPIPAADSLTSATTRIQRAEREIERLRSIVSKDPKTVMIAFEDGDHMRLSRAAGNERKRADLAEAQLADAVKVLNGLLAIVDDSRGVDGYHRNGDVAEWDEFPEIEDARTFLSTIGEKPDAE